MTTTRLPADKALNAVLDRAAFDADRVISTQHLLLAVAGEQPVAEILDAYDLTPLALRELAKDRPDEPGAVERTPPAWHRALTFSDAAAAALDRYRARSSRTDSDDDGLAGLLLAVLDDSQSRAADLLKDAGTDTRRLRAAVAGEPGEVPADPVPVPLRSARDALLGRRRYQPTGRGRWLRALLLRLPINVGLQPVLWTQLEARELAQRHRGPLRSDDVLLALVTVHQVAGFYPHMTRRSKYSYALGAELAAAGLDHQRVSTVMNTTDLGEDAVPVATLLGDWPAGTPDILRKLFSAKENRSARLLAELRVEPASFTATR